MKDGDDGRLWSKFNNANLAIVDEVGTRSNPSDFETDCLRDILEHRIGRPLIVISNLSLDELAKLYDDRIPSRLAGGTIHKLVGSDRRLRRKRVVPHPDSVAIEGWPTVRTAKAELAEQERKIAADPTTPAQLATMANWSARPRT
jgi:hypothetical protein